MKTVTPVSDGRMSGADTTETDDVGVADKSEKAGEAGKEEAEKTGNKSPVDQHISGLQLFVVMTSVTLVGFLMLLDTSIIATAIPRITDEFHSLQDIGWYISAYQLASAALQPLAGKIYSFFSTKWSFLSFFAVFELGSLLCGAAVSSTMLVVGRAVAGMGSAGLLNGMLTIVAGSVPLEKRAALMGILMGCVQLGVATGPLIGGALTEYSSWRWCFYINLPIGGAVAVFLVLCRIPDQVAKPSPRSVVPLLHRKLDLVGFALFAPAAVMLLLALEYGGSGRAAWGSATVIGQLCGSAGAFAVWAVWNAHKGDGALVPVAIMRRTPVWCGALTQTFLFITMFVASYFVPIYFQGVRGESPLLSGVYLLPSILSQLLAAVVSGFLVGRLGFVVPWALAGSVLSSVGAGLFGRFGPDTPVREWVGFQVLNGLGRGLSMQMPILAVQAALSPAEIAVAMSLLTFVQYLGSSVFLVAGNAIFSRSLVSELAAHVPGVDAAAVAAAGATAFRSLVSPQDLPAVLRAYATSLDRTFYLGAASAAAWFFSAWGLGWVDIRKKGGVSRSVGCETES